MLLLNPTILFQHCNFKAIEDFETIIEVSHNMSSRHNKHVICGKRFFGFVQILDEKSRSNALRFLLNKRPDVYDLPF